VGIHALNRYQVGGIRNRKRAQPYPVHQAEDSGVCPDAKRQRDDGRQKRAGCTPESAKSETNVMDEVNKLTPPSYSGC